MFYNFGEKVVIVAAVISTVVLPAVEVAMERIVDQFRIRV
jgi:cytochrome b subunit of formate dehydrogenase